MKYYLGIDLGGTNIAAGLVDEHGSILQSDRRKTNAPRSLDKICEDMAQLCDLLIEKQGIGKEDISWVGLGTPGVVWDGVVCFSSNLDLHDEPMARMLSDMVQLPVFMHNDANAAAYGEYLLGAGKGKSSLVAVTIGTGIGSGIVLDNHIWDGFNGAAPELGHIIIEPGGRECRCGNCGCFEAYCSATGLIRSTREAMEAHPKSLMWKIADGRLENVNGKTAFDARLEGDNIASDVIARFIEYLAIGVSNVINMLQPETLCIGGGVSAQGDTIILPLRERVAPITFAGRDGLRTEITTAKLGNDAGIIGAAMLGRLHS